MINTAIQNNNQVKLLNQLLTNPNKTKRHLSINLSLQGILNRINKKRTVLDNRKNKH